MNQSPRLRPWLDALEDRLVPSIDLTGVEFRTIDGTNNNLALPNQGAAETRQIRFGYGAQFPDGFGDAIITAPQRANPRTISNRLHAQAGSVLNDRMLTDWSFQWGQWITHDIDLTRTGEEFNVLSTGVEGDFSIPVVDPGDPFGTAPIPFNRSQFDVGTGVPGARREVVNSITSYIDASMVYGSDPVRAAALRTFQGGKLKTSANGQLLPLNTAGLPNADAFNLGSQLFLAGDVRANEQVNLTVVHTLFVREHNRLATRIKQLDPTLGDEEIYQLARRIVGAEMQIITYEEYLPSVLGFDLSPRPEGAIYNPSTNATITNSFAHAVFRFGHSQISPSTLLVNNNGSTAGSLSIAQAFFNPNVLKNDPANVARMLKGLSSQMGQENDLLLVDGVRNSLFGPPGNGGLDLAALDIQRGRDHGLPDYNNLRARYGLAPVTTFAEISSDPAIQARLQELFGTVNNIDPFVGALAEDHLPGSSAGEFIHAVVGNQFERLRDGDRFFYTQDAFLQSNAVRQVIDLSKVTLAQVIRWNTGITNLQDNVFFDKSVLVVEAPASGSNITVVAGAGLVSVLNLATGELTVRSLSNVSQVILVGSRSAADVFNVAIGAANGGIEHGVLVYGGSSTGDVLNVIGTLQADTIAVDADSVNVNGNNIDYSGIDAISIITLLGNDDVDVGLDVLIPVDVY